MRSKVLAAASLNGLTDGLLRRVTEDRPWRTLLLSADDGEAACMRAQPLLVRCKAPLRSLRASAPAVAMLPCDPCKSTECSSGRFSADGTRTSTRLVCGWEHAPSGGKFKFMKGARGGWVGAAGGLKIQRLQEQGPGSSAGWQRRRPGVKSAVRVRIIAAFGFNVGNGEAVIREDAPSTSLTHCHWHTRHWD